MYEEDSVENYIVNETWLKLTFEPIVNASFLLPSLQLKYVV